MGYLNQGDSDCEPALACLVMKHVHCCQCTRSTAKKSKSPLRPLNKPVEEKKALVPFAKMAHYISLLDDADEMMDEFNDFDGDDNYDDEY